MKLVALDTRDEAVIQFADSTEAGIWAKLPTQDIETAVRTGDRIYGYVYAEYDEDIHQHAPKWGDMDSQELNADALYAIAMLSNIDREGMIFDKTISEMLTAEQIYDRYWANCTVRDLFEAVRSSAEKKHAILDRVDEEKKEIQQMLIAQPETDKNDKQCIYVPESDVPEVLKNVCEDLGIEGEVKYEGGECYLGMYNGVRYFAVHETVEPFTLEDWKGDKANKSK